MGLNAKTAALLCSAILMPVIAGCGGGGHSTAYLPSNCAAQQVKPSNFFVACATGQAGLQKLAWKGWGDATARAKGFAYKDDCEPDCVSGGYHYSQAELFASRLRRCRNGKMQYTYAVIVTSPAASALAGAYNVSCGDTNSGSLEKVEPGESED